MWQTDALARQGRVYNTIILTSNCGHCVFLPLHLCSPLQLIKTKYYSSAMFTLHQINAYEDNGYLIMDMCCGDDGSVIGDFTMENLHQASGEELDKVIPSQSSAWQIAIMLTSLSVSSKSNFNATCLLAFPVLQFIEYNLTTPICTASGRYGRGAQWPQPHQFAVHHCLCCEDYNWGKWTSCGEMGDWKKIILIDINKSNFSSVIIGVPHPWRSLQWWPVAVRWSWVSTDKLHFLQCSSLSLFLRLWLWTPVWWLFA